MKHITLIVLLFITTIVTAANKNSFVNKTYEQITPKEKVTVTFDTDSTFNGKVISRLLPNNEYYVKGKFIPMIKLETNVYLGILCSYQVSIDNYCWNEEMTEMHTYESYIIIFDDTKNKVSFNVLDNYIKISY